MKDLTNDFSVVDGRGSYWARQTRLFKLQKVRAEERERIEEKAEAGISAMMATAVIATELQIKAFELTLDQYETATVEALIANQEALDVVRERIDVILMQAHVLDDGRRVFKTEDGTQVFDEFGEKVGPEIIDPDEVDDSKTTWEEYAQAREAEQALASERSQLIEFQQKLDEARDEIADGQITVDELNDLEAQLDQLAPPAVATQMPGWEAPASTAATTSVLEQTISVWKPPVASGG